MRIRLSRWLFVFVALATPLLADEQDDYNSPYESYDVQGCAYIGRLAD